MAAKPPPLFLRRTRNFQNALHVFQRRGAVRHHFCSVGAARRQALRRRFLARKLPPYAGKGGRVVSAARTQHVAPPRAYARACA